MCQYEEIIIFLSFRIDKHIPGMIGKRVHVSVFPKFGNRVADPLAKSLYFSQNQLNRKLGKIPKCRNLNPWLPDIWMAA